MTEFLEREHPSRGVGLAIRRPIRRLALVSWRFGFERGVGLGLGVSLLGVGQGSCQCRFRPRTLD